MEINSNSFPPLNSYRGQHALMAIILTTLLVTVAWIGYFYVQNQSIVKIERIGQRAIAETSVADVREQLINLEEWLQFQIISPSDDNQQQLASRLQGLKAAMDRLDSLQFISEDPILYNVILSLKKDYLEVEKNTSRLVEITSDIGARFPSTLIMQSELLPHAEAIVSSLNTAIFETMQVPEESDPLLLYEIFELRHNWLSMVSEFRLYVANRFGVFSGTPRAGMASRMTNILLFRNRFDKHLEFLKQSANDNEALFIDASFWDDIENHAEQWNSAFERLRVRLTSTEWRMDLQVLRDQILPISTRMKSRISSMNLELDTQASADITGLTDIAANLSRTIIILAGIAITVILLGYYYLKYRLILPIARTTQILKAEAQGISGQELPQSKLQETQNLVEAFREMREQVQIRQLSLDHMAHHDALTQLPNRVLFRDRLYHALRIAKRNKQQTGLMFLDLDRFKQVNDSLGHIAGDKLLIEVANRLKQTVRESDTIARLSGDEFAILVEDISDHDTMSCLGDELLANLERPILIQDNEIHISASIGIAMAPKDSNEVDDLIRDADTAMYEAKYHGKANYHFYSASMATQASDRMLLEQRLRQSLKQQEFGFYYQPIIDLKTGSPQSFEALIRWQPRQEQIKAPDSFLASLLETGLIADVTRDLLQHIADAQQTIKHELGIETHFALNIPGPILRSKSNYTAFLKTLCNSDIKRSNLTIEITEDTLIEDITNAEQFLAALKKENVKIALDDFGTGQSSLSHVRMFPFDIIKIDKEFVRDIRTDPNDASLVNVIIQLAHNFGMQVIAEGVETTEQFEFLLHADCDLAQGFMISRPLSLEDLADYLGQQITSLVSSSSA